MIVINAIILGIIQAITEFLPISSSGHLLLLHDWLSLEMVDSLTFDVAVHWGTLAALCVYFRKDIAYYFRAAWQLCRHPNLTRDEQRTVVNVIVATIPAVVAGYFLSDIIDAWFRTPLSVAVALIIGGLLFFMVERWSRQKLVFEGLSVPEAFLIGCAQAVALIPGVSRSGSTMIAGMALHLKREQAARFSFLISMPVVFAAGTKTFLELDVPTVSLREWYVMGVGMVVSAVVGYIVISLFLQFLARHSLKVFAWYRILLGVGILALLWFS